jgi:glycosyltransferase involved in cell wall biosynthesis
MKIHHIVAHPPFREGTGTVCYYNARALQELGCDVRVYAAKHGSFNPGSAPLDFYHFLPSWLSIGNAYLTPGLLGMQPADVFHLHYPFIFGSDLTIFKSWLAHTPMVLTYHNDLIGGGIRRPSFWVYNRTYGPWILRNARKIVVTSLDYAATSFFGQTIFARRQADLVEVGNGVAVDEFRPEVECGFVRPRHGLTSKDFILLFVSSLDHSHARKGLGFLLDTLATIHDNRIKLVVVGDGDMRLEYREQAARSGLEARVSFAGRVSQSELPGYYAAADVVCIPSRPPEAFGVALAQGMSAGKPVIASDIPGVRTLVKPECGTLIPVGDENALAEAITRLAGNPGLCRELGAAGRKRIEENYTWRRAGEKLLAMYQGIVSR